MKKRILVTALTVVLAITLGVAVFASDTISSSLRLGDVNGDGDITAADALEVLQYANGKIDTFTAEKAVDPGDGPQYNQPDDPPHFYEHFEDTPQAFVNWLNDIKDTTPENVPLRASLETLKKEGVLYVPQCDATLKNVYYTGFDDGIVMYTYVYDNYFYIQVALMLDDTRQAHDAAENLTEFCQNTNVPLDKEVEDDYSKRISSIVPIDFNGQSEGLYTHGVFNYLPPATNRDYAEITFFYDKYTVTLQQKYAKELDWDLVSSIQLDEIDF
ncbi:MAG: dockerin type I domain-containing protein [Acutalibacteraceae bacterium]|jgi:hypothetical protein